MAFTNTAATLPGIIVPIFVGKLTHSDVSMKILMQCQINNDGEFLSSLQSVHGELFSVSQLFSTSLR